jgi:hypothetical protein
VCIERKKRASSDFQRLARVQDMFSKFGGQSLNIKFAETNERRNRELSRKNRLLVRKYNVQKRFIACCGMRYPAEEILTEIGKRLFAWRQLACYELQDFVVAADKECNVFV